MAEMLCTEAEGTVTVNIDQIRREGGRGQPTQAGELSVTLRPTAGVELRHSRDEVVVTEGQEVSLTVSPPVEQSWRLEIIRTEISLRWPAGDWRGDHLNISYRLHLQPDIFPLVPLFLLLPRLDDDDELELAVVPGGGSHLVDVI